MNEKDRGKINNTGSDTNDTSGQTAPEVLTALVRQAGLKLVSDRDRLALTDGKMLLYGDFETMLPRIRKGNIEREFLVKASGIKGLKDTSGRPRAIDATAGLGEDALLLAAAGFYVDLYEYDPVIAALLRDALRRAVRSSEEILAEAAGRMRLFEEDSVTAMQSAVVKAAAPDVIFLDPMFPERRKSALVKKKFQLLQQLESPCGDSGGAEMLAAAEAAHPRRIIIKRPLKGEFLAGRKPDYSVRGKTIRYDCIIIPR